MFLHEKETDRDRGMESLPILPVSRQWMGQRERQRGEKVIAVCTASFEATNALIQWSVNGGCLRRRRRGEPFRSQATARARPLLTMDLPRNFVLVLISCLTYMTCRVISKIFYAYSFFTPKE